MFILKTIDRFLNSITMYKLVLYGLAFLSVLSLFLSEVNLLPFSTLELLALYVSIFSSAWATQKAWQFITKIPTNTESFAITALILCLVLAPSVSVRDLAINVFITVIAMSSKFILVGYKQHIWNPVAIALVAAGVLGFGNAIWWIGSAVLLPCTLIFALLIVHKIRRVKMWSIFTAVGLLSVIAFNLRFGTAPLDSLRQTLLSGPLIFFGGIMLTEPLTTPAGKKLRYLYAGIVGFLFGAQFHIGPLFSSPELALVIGNIFSYLVNPKVTLMLQFQEKIQIAANIYEFIFKKNVNFTFKPGQYLEWTINPKAADSRGNRRYFTIASSPTEETVHIGVRVSPNASSSYKKELLALQKGDAITAHHLAGDFTLPSDPKQKLVFIAGGIGVTPFRSMIKYLIDIKQSRDIILFFVCKQANEFVYADIFGEAKKWGVTTIQVITHREHAPLNWSGEIGYLTPELLQKYVPDYIERNFYLSGPNAMVAAYKEVLEKMQLSDTHIKTDYFPGF